MTAPPLKLAGVFPILATPLAEGERFGPVCLAGLVRFMAPTGVDISAPVAVEP